jgi:hypothetical protein
LPWVHRLARGQPVPRLAICMSRKCDSGASRCSGNAAPIPRPQQPE